MTAIGRQLGRYRILSALGAGGMGEVYRAHDSRLSRDVAIKFLKPHPGGVDQTTAVLSEARAASQLSHANICQVYEVDGAEGQTFLVMELVEGETLRGPLPADRVARHGAQIAAALAHAHDRGIIHRDLKSANVMLTTSGEVKVLDFGIARREPPSAMEETTRSVAPFQRDDAIAGTLAYMPPETVRTGRADARGDSWSSRRAPVRIADRAAAFCRRVAIRTGECDCQRASATVTRHRAAGVAADRRAVFAQGTR